MSRTDELNKILRALQSSTPDIEAASIMTDDGLVIASALPQHIEEIRVAGISATILSLGTRATAELERGHLEQVLIRGANGYIVMAAASQGTLLMVMTTREAKLGLIFLDMSRAIQEIKKVL